MSNAALCATSTASAANLGPRGPERPLARRACLGGCQWNSQPCRARARRLTPCIAAMAAQNDPAGERPEAADERSVEPGLQLSGGDRMTMPDEVEVDAVIAARDGDVECLGGGRGMELAQQQLE